MKYVMFILRADNHGEGGIYALAALFLSKGRESVSPSRVNLIVLLAIFGAALLCGEGLITPVISVLSAMEGLNVATTAAQPFVLPLSCGVILGLFLVQSQGTERIGTIFGPIMIFWFAAIALLGLMPICPDAGDSVGPGPTVCGEFFATNGLHGVLVLGAVVLCITGCEALYADMNHFGRAPSASPGSPWSFPPSCSIISVKPPFCWKIRNRPSILFMGWCPECSCIQWWAWPRPPRSLPPRP